MSEGERGGAGEEEEENTEEDYQESNSEGKSNVKQRK